MAYWYHPELDVTPELKADGLQRYQELIGILQWAVKLGRVDIPMETSIHDVDPLGYAEAGTSRTSTPYFWLSQGMTKTEVIFQPAAPTIGMTSTGMQKSQFRGTCLHLGVRWFQCTAL